MSVAQAMQKRREGLLQQHSELDNGFTGVGRAATRVVGAEREHEVKSESYSG